MRRPAHPAVHLRAHGGMGTAYTVQQYSAKNTTKAAGWVLKFEKLGLPMKVVDDRAHAPGRVAPIFCGMRYGDLTGRAGGSGCECEVSGLKGGREGGHGFSTTFTHSECWRGGIPTLGGSSHTRCLGNFTAGRRHKNQLSPMRATKT